MAIAWTVSPRWIGAGLFDLGEMSDGDAGGRRGVLLRDFAPDSPAIDSSDMDRGAATRDDEGSASVEFGDQIADSPFDLIAGSADLVERAVGGVG